MTDAVVRVQPYFSAGQFKHVVSRQLASNTYPLTRTEVAEIGALSLLPILATLRLAPVIAFVLFGCVFAATMLAYAVFAWDKNRAQLKKPRIPEFLLHLMELLGGWPGSYVAQRHFAHKIMKRRYQNTFWVIVVAHHALAAGILMRGLGLI